MPFSNIYTDPILKYPLTSDEYKEIDKVWTFLEIFNSKYVFISDYRAHLLKRIRKLYGTPEEFLRYELIANKLFWNLRFIVFPLWILSDRNEEADDVNDVNDINDGISRESYDAFMNNEYSKVTEVPQSLLLCTKIKYNDTYDLHKKLLEVKEHLYADNYYRSFINKLILVNSDEKIIYYKPIEGSSDIFSKNYFNLYTTSVLLDKDRYEKIMADPVAFTKRFGDVPAYYYQYDYGFPNLNLCTYSIGSYQTMLDRVTKMYYDDKGKPMEHWYKLMVPPPITG